MADLISKQVVLKEIERLMGVYFDRKVVLSKVWDAVDALPSAQLAQDLTKGCTDTISCVSGKKGKIMKVKRECKEYEITIEKLMRVVHNYTDPIRICVVIRGDRWDFPEARHMHDFFLTKRYTYRDEAEKERLLKYYKDVPVWNLTVWMDFDIPTERGRAVYTGIEAHCYYSDIRRGYLAEREDIKRAKRREYRKRKKEGEQDG